MKSKPTPWTHTGTTSQELTVEFGPSGCPPHTINVPSGTRCRKLEGGSATWVVHDLDFIQDKKSLLYSDADVYGIRIAEEHIVDIQPVALR